MVRVEEQPPGIRSGFRSNDVRAIASAFAASPRCSSSAARRTAADCAPGRASSAASRWPIAALTSPRDARCPSQQELGEVARFGITRERSRRSTALGRLRGFLRPVEIPDSRSRFDTDVGILGQRRKQTPGAPTSSRKTKRPRRSLNSGGIELSGSASGRPLPDDVEPAGRGDRLLEAKRGSDGNRISARSMRSASRARCGRETGRWRYRQSRTPPASAAAARYARSARSGAPRSINCSCAVQRRPRHTPGRPRRASRPLGTEGSPFRARVPLRPATAAGGGRAPHRSMPGPSRASGAAGCGRPRLPRARRPVSLRRSAPRHADPACAASRSGAIGRSGISFSSADRPWDERRPGRGGGPRRQLEAIASGL